VLDVTQETRIETVHVPALVGNWVSHYETAVGASLAPTVLLGVLRTIDEFADAFGFDCRCDRSVRRKYYKSLDSRGCRC
jgi:hypothetical protein